MRNSSLVFATLVLHTNIVRAGLITSQEYKVQMAGHRGRMAEAVPIVLRQFGDYFRGVSTELARDYILGNHDVPKILTRDQLSKWGYAHPRDIAERLVEFYGRNQEQLSVRDRKILNSVREELNDIENLQKQIFVQVSDISASTRSHVVDGLKRLEHILDVTDVGLYRQKEMGIPDQPYNGEKFLLQKENDPLGARISRYLEDRYKELFSAIAPSLSETK